MTGARWAALALVVSARTASADGLDDDDLWRYRAGAIAIDGGVLAALPAALETGLARGFDAGVTVGDERLVPIVAAQQSAVELTAKIEAILSAHRRASSRRS